MSDRRKFVSLLTLPSFLSPRDFYINRARRGELPDLLNFDQAGLLCVAADTGDDSDRGRLATQLLWSLEAGGLLASTELEGKRVISPDALRGVAHHLLTAGFWSEAAALWSGVTADCAGETSPAEKPLKAQQLKLALIGANGAIKNPKGNDISWKEFLRLPGLESAKRGKSGKFWLWSLREVKEFCDSTGYKIEKIAVSPIQGITGSAADPFGIARRIVHKMS